MNKKWYQVNEYSKDIMNCRLIDSHKETEHFVFYIDKHGREQRDKKVTSWQRILQRDDAIAYIEQLKKDKNQAEKDRLIEKAAKELYYTVAALTDALESLVGECPEVEKGRAALAKAEGN